MSNAELPERIGDCGKRSFNAGLRYCGLPDIERDLKSSDALIEMARRYGLGVYDHGRVYNSRNEPVLAIYRDGKTATDAEYHAVFASDVAPWKSVYVLIAGWEDLRTRVRADLVSGAGAPITAPLQSEILEVDDDRWRLKAYYESLEAAEAALGLLRTGRDYELASAPAPSSDGAPKSNREPHPFQEHPHYPDYCAFAVGDEDYCKREQNNEIHKVTVKPVSEDGAVVAARDLAAGGYFRFDPEHDDNDYQQTVIATAAAIISSHLPATTAAPSAGPEEPQREFDHFSIVPFKAICGADVPNQSTTQTPERAKCATCWHYYQEWNASRGR